MLKRMTLFLVMCLAAGALVPPLRGVSGDPQNERHVASLARQAGVLEFRVSRRDRDGGAPRIDSAVWLTDGGDRLCDAGGARRTDRTRCASNFPSYHLATHLSL